MESNTIKIGSRVEVVSYEDGFTESLLGEKGTVVDFYSWSSTRKDVIVDLDCGLKGLIFDYEMELEIIKTPLKVSE